MSLCCALQYAIAHIAQLADIFLDKLQICFVLFVFSTYPNHKIIKEIPM